MLCSWWYSVCRNDPATINCFEKVWQQYLMSSLWKSIVFIKWKIIIKGKGVRVSQRSCIDPLLYQPKLFPRHEVPLPLPCDADFAPRHAHELSLSLQDHHIFQSIYGGLSCLPSCTRPDKTFYVSMLSCSFHDTPTQYPGLFKHFRRYSAGAIKYCLYFPSSSSITSISAPTTVEVDWVCSKFCLSSTSSYTFCNSEAPIFWNWILFPVNCCSRHQTSGTFGVVGLLKTYVMITSTILLNGPPCCLTRWHYNLTYYRGFKKLNQCIYGKNVKKQQTYKTNSTTILPHQVLSKQKNN